MRDQDVPAVAAVGVAPHPGLLTADATGLRLSALTPETAALTVLRHGRTTVTAGALDRTVRTISMGLAAAGVAPGDRVAAVLRNRIELVELLLGCAHAGAVLVPVNWRLAHEELLGVIADARPAAIVVEQDTEEALDGLDASILRLRIGPGSRPVTDYAEWLAAHAPAGAHRRAVDGVVLQVYTSGTSGVPKGVQLTAVNIGAKVEHVGRAWEFGRDAVSLLATPLSHIGALSWALVGLRAGATTVIATSAAADELAATFRGNRISHAFLVPTLLRRLCEALPEDETLPSLRHIVYGAAPITPAEQRRAARRLGCDLHQLYGLTETTGGITQLDTGPGTVDTPEALSVGLPYPWVEIEIRDPESGSSVMEGESGEVWTRSVQNTVGYACRPDETAALLTADGWLRTGDGGRIGPGGHLFLTDRIKDMIVTGGENVYSVETERVLREHPDVADAAVVGIPDARWGELVTAVVVPRAGADLDPAAVIEFTAGRIAGYKRPRRVVLTEELPRNATGKVLKRSLRRDLAARQEGMAR